jgi:hypothetical protein
MNDQFRTLGWRHGNVSVQALGGMLGPAVFILPDGRQVSPFHIAPWWNEPESAELDGLTRGLRGEWPCVPFGYPMPAESFVDRWQSAIDPDETAPDVHGYGSGHDWSFEAAQGDAIDMSIDYPPEHDVVRLERRIAPDPDGPAIDFTLTIHPRRDCDLPVALHGCFALPVDPGAARLVPGEFGWGLSFPGTIEPDATLFKPDARFQSLERVPARAGGDVDASQLPFDRSVEELLQLNDIDGRFSLENRHAGYRMVFTWDAEKLPSTLLWYSNRGRQFAPWNGRHVCIGIEPCAAPFGVAPGTAARPNPISEAGTPTSVAFKAGKPVDIRYRVAVEPL